MEPESIHDSTPSLSSLTELPGQRVKLSFTDRIRKFFLSKQEWEAYIIGRERKRKERLSNKKTKGALNNKQDTSDPPDLDSPAVSI